MEASPGLAQVPPPSSWSDYATVAVTFKCKFCDFDTEDLPALKSHHECAHANVSDPGRPTSIREENSSGNGRRGSSTQLAARQSERPPILPPPHKMETGVQSPSSEIYLCSECNVTFNSEALCYEHMSFEHGLEEFNEQIGSSESLRQETKPTPLLPTLPRPKRKTGPPKLMTLEGGGVVVPKKYRRDLKTMCNLCKAKFEQEEILQIHQQCHNRKENSILEKNLNSASNQDGPDETDEHSSPKKVLGYSCILCKLTSASAVADSGGKEKGKDARFAKWGQCAIHLWRQHNIDCELYQCSKCPFKAYAKTTLTEHENIHGIVSKFKCQTCHKEFKQLSQLKNHEKYHKEKSTKLPPPGEERWYTPKICPVCGRVLSDQKCLKRHISYVHNKLKQHVCNVCGHMAARKAELQLHMRQHTGERPYKCPLCTFSTIYPGSFRRHKVTHTLNFAYSCAYCDYKCIQSNAFKLHMKTKHPDEEGIFKCSFCAYESVNSTLFEAHVKSHSETGASNNESHSCPCPVIDTDTNDTMNSNDDEDEDEDEDHEETRGRSRRQISVRTQSWLQEVSSDDENSSEVIEDNSGGVTIPAPAPVPAPASEGE